MALPPPPFLYPILDTGLLAGRSLGTVLRGLLRGGARVVQLRAKGVPDRRFSELAREACEAVRGVGGLLIINDRPDIARVVGAAGVHLGQDDLDPAQVRSFLGGGAILGLSTHSLEQVERGLRSPVDYLAIGPVFPTRTKKDAEPVVGTDLLQRARRLTERPLVAIGGIDASNARSAVDAGAHGVAVISAILGAEDAEAATRELVRALA
jgi:thiamine-phosphate pyrophosphorylase